MSDAPLDCRLAEGAMQRDAPLVALVHRDHEYPVAFVEGARERPAVSVVGDGDLGAGQPGRPRTVADDESQLVSAARELTGDETADVPRRPRHDDRHSDSSATRARGHKRAGVTNSATTAAIAAAAPPSQNACENAASVGTDVPGIVVEVRIAAPI